MGIVLRTLAGGAVTDVAQNRPLPETTKMASNQTNSYLDYIRSEIEHLGT